MAIITDIDLEDITFVYWSWSIYGHGDFMTSDPEEHKFHLLRFAVLDYWLGGRE